MKYRILTIALLVLMLGACRTTGGGGIYGVTAAPVVSNLANPSKEDVRKAIQRAGATLGWQIRENGPDALIGVLNLRSHSATIDIPYSAKQYSISYKDSKDLNYTGTSIHNNYNGWIQNLEKGIQAQLKNL